MPEYELLEDQEEKLNPLVEYEKQTWINHIETKDTHEVIQEGTVIEAKRLNHMEDGIAACAGAVNTLSVNMESVSNVTRQVEEKGFVVSVTHLKDEEDEEENQKLIFTMSDGRTLSVAIGVTQTYQVNYYDGATLLFSDIVKSGKNSIFTIAPTRPSTAQYDYTFLGWSSTLDGEVEEGLQEGITDNKNLYAVFDAEIRSYMVTFLKEGQTLYSGELEYGEMPEYDGSALSNADGRPFDQWTPALESVKGPVTYNASFKHRLRYYNGDTLLKTEYVGEGQIPDTTYTPTKSSTAQYSYTFSGWTTVQNSTIAESDALRAMDGDRDLYAIFTQNLRQYTVTWSMNGTDQTATYYYGQTPTAPTVSAADGRSFSSWDKTIATVTEDVTYTARYQRMVRFYNGSTLLKTQYVDYGANATYSGSTPTKSSTAAYTYSFSGWSSTNGGSASSTILNNITSDKDVYAVFSASTRYYTVSFYNGSTLLQSKSVAYGGTASYTGSTPTKASTAQYTYSFSGWDSSLTNITSSKSVYATFSSTIRKYTITFKHSTTATVYYIYSNGSKVKNTPAATYTLYTTTVAYGATPTYSGPRYSLKEDTSYSAASSFKWNPAISTVTGDTTYYGTT